MTGGKPKRQWRNFLLDWRFQLKYTAAVVIISAVISLVLGWFLYKAQQETFETSRENSQLLAMDDFPELNKEVQEELAREDAKIKARNSKVLTILILSLGCMVFCLSFLGIIATHKIAGPAYAMRRILSLIADGKHPHVRKLRKGDELRAVSLELKRMADYLRERDESELAGLEETLKNLESAGQVPEPVSKWIKETIENKRTSLGADS